MDNLLFGFVWCAPFLLFVGIVDLIFEHFDRTPEEEPKENGEF